MTPTLIALFMMLLLCSASSALKSKVIVTGAAGRTGALVLQKLLRSEKFDPVAVVRTKKSFKKLFKLGAKPEQVIIGDVTSQQGLEQCFAGADSLVLCTSAVPKIKIWSLIKVLLLKIIRKVARPEFRFIPNGDPYNVDWLGAKRQVDAAKAAGVKHIVFVSSMGGTQPENFLNTIGRKEDDEKSGNILLWKRKAEKYLIESGLKYTIVHPGGLTNAKGGESEIIMGFNDELLKQKVRSIPREDVAEVCVQALEQEGAVNRSFDIITSHSSNSPNPDTFTAKPTTNWAEFFSKEGNCVYE